MKAIIFIFAGLLLSCQAGRSTNNSEGRDSLPPGIYKYWSHSYEEDTEEWKAYRPDEFDFPPSRGREGFGLKKDGQFILYKIAPADGLLSIEGKWELIQESTIKATFSDPDYLPKVFKIISLEDEVLKIRWLE